MVGSASPSPRAMEQRGASYFRSVHRLGIAVIIEASHALLPNGRLKRGQSLGFGFEEVIPNPENALRAHLQYPFRLRWDAIDEQIDSHAIHGDGPRQV
jgi:hypothetical protein